ncbi:hypothetical protein [Paenibacillus arenosi]|uniref:Uncharacterized protein n=1 Tax=Paenibacillus arenosi TaxID=2774142 RepID=A0ABR9AYQ8_9BACL|nr:hypothetical protein [Paenibacillus arenosi]MBD8499277.1 hypothetical protein [Paenibacillus arenosi]
MRIRKSLPALICISLLLVGCVSQSEFDQVQNEKRSTEEKLVNIEKDLELVRKNVERQANELNKISVENLQLKEKIALYRSAINPNSYSNNYNTNVEEEQK